MYILDAGESSSRKVNMVYMVPEPGALRDQTLTVAAKLPFKWSEIDGQTIMVDNHGEVYVASNVLGGKGLLAHLPSSGWGSATPVNATSSVHINITTRHHDPTSGDISSNGKELILRAKENVFYWSVANYDYLGAVTNPPVELPQYQESVGEAIFWDRTGTNFYTLSEGLYSTLYKFVRVPTGYAVS